MCQTDGTKDTSFVFRNSKQNVLMRTFTSSTSSSLHCCLYRAAWLQQLGFKKDFNSNNSSVLFPLRLHFFVFVCSFTLSLKTISQNICKPLKTDQVCFLYSKIKQRQQIWKYFQAITYVVIVLLHLSSPTKQPNNEKYINRFKKLYKLQQKLSFLSFFFREKSLPKI